MRVPPEVPPEKPRPRRRLRAWLIAAAVVLVLLLASLWQLAEFYTDKLWFDSVGFGGVWSGLLGARIVPAAAFTTLFFVVMLANLIIADRIAPKLRTGGPEDEIVDRYRQVVGPYQGRIRLGIAFFFALITGIGVSAQWREWILFRNSVDFGIKDPQFNMDIGFYVFQLPFLKFVVQWTFASLVIVLIVTAITHYLNGGIRLQAPHQRVTPQVKAHLSVILAVMALVRAVDYWLGRYELTSSARGVVDGASYTDVNAQIPALQLLAGVAVVAAALFIWNIFRRGWVLPVIAVGLWGLVSVTVGTIYPAVIQRFRVDPNELSKESEFIERNIEATRQAFAIDDVEQVVFPYEPTLTAEQVNQNLVTVDNARLWDPAPLQGVYRTRQEVGSFYEFADVDIDRYMVDGTIQQVLLSARDLSPEKLPSRSWTNEHLVFTHGYGAVVSEANTREDDGDPRYLLSDIPTVGDAIPLEQPRIYFGEGISGFAYVDSKQEEFDFPRSDEESDDAEFTRYDGAGGVEVSSPVKRAAFALRFGDWNTLWSDQIESGTKALFRRNIRDRVEAAAPFLEYDADPYPIILDGRVLWMIDGYTTTDKYPYSQAINDERLRSGSGLRQNLNYVRNSVKATVDAYDGTISFYVVDPDDPIIQAYEKAFPDLFTDLDEAPDGLEEHFRYPDDLFRVQTDVYAKYHVTDVSDFFNGNDLWVASPDPGSGELGSEPVAPAAPADENTEEETEEPRDIEVTSKRMDPLYLLTKVPGDESEGFLILQPFVPISENDRLINMRSFMTAKSDPGEYGRLQAFVMPRDQQVKGPVEADNAINSTAEISQEFTLLNVEGSTVIQGNLQTIPIEDSIVYIRPIYVESNIARLRFVTAYDGEKAVLRETLDEALAALYPGFRGIIPEDTSAVPEELQADPDAAPPDEEPDGETPDTTEPETPDTTEPAPTGSAAELLQQADQAFADADEALKNEDLGEYQNKIDEGRDLLGRALELLAQESGGDSSALGVTSGGPGLATPVALGPARPAIPWASSGT
ncbi:MAG: UPF0182 family protein [Acidimicrobiia bacterium]